MNDAISCCSRCGTPTSDKALVLGVEREISESVPQELRLCPTCVESFERWYRKLGKSSSKWARSPQAEGSLALPTSFGSNRSKRRRSRKKQIRRFLVITSLTILVFLVVFYWTWTILKSATRIEE